MSRSRFLFAWPLSLGLCFAGPAHSVEEVAVPLEGHSGHGASFNEGPRQAAYLMGGTGDVHLPITTASDEAQLFFDQGLGQLHGFWYFEAERSFRQVAAIDPDCAMAYWGMARANHDNFERAPGFAYEAWCRRDGTSDLERRHIESMARYFGVAFEIEAESEEEIEKETEKKIAEASKAPEKSESKKRRKRIVTDLEEIVGEYPDDIETKALLVNRLWLNTWEGMEISSRQANQALLDQIFERNPMHPAHHYRVHLWDRKETSHRSTTSSAVIGHTAPNIAHMWHMGGHVWARLDRHADAAFQQEASARVDHARMMRDRILPDRIHNYAHNNEWLSRSLRHVGRVRESIDLSKNMIELPRHPDVNVPTEGGGSASYGRRRLIETLRLFELWDLAIELADSMYLEACADAEDSRERLELIGTAALYRRATGDRQRARDSVRDLEAVIEEVRVERATAAAKAEDEAIEADKKPKEIDESIEAAIEPFSRQVRDIRAAIGRLASLEEFLRLRRDDGDEEEMRTALKGLESGFERSLLAALQAEAGFLDDAIETAREEAKDKANQAITGATLAAVLHAAGKSDEAKEAFDALREGSAHFDLELPPFARLAPLAAALGHPSDWRGTDPTRDDVGDRPELGSLGPFRWSPTAAEPFTLSTGFGNEVDLATYRGRPVLVIFFLGFGCVHCVEQLGEFAPKAGAYADAGIPIVTIGSDSVEQLRKSQANDSAEERFPFPILADPEFTVFKEYRVWDDFERIPLHGTFLIDGDGLVRWHDVSYEPFMDADWLLEESRRLLGLPRPGERAH